jgi:predicted phosphoribosyltransferase
VTRLSSDATLINGLAAGRAGQMVQILAMTAGGIGIAFANGWKLSCTLLAYVVSSLY